MIPAAATPSRIFIEIKLTSLQAKDFWSRVKKAGKKECWIWQRGKHPKGYGLFWINRHGLKANRVAWVLTHGPIPDGLFVCHDCDTPACCNPAHFFLGTHGDNMRDMVKKGRSTLGDRNGARLHPETRARGSGHGCALLTEDQVLDFRKRHAAGEKAEALAGEFGVARSTGYAIVKRVIWKHLS